MDALETCPSPRNAVRGIGVRANRRLKPLSRASIERGLQSVPGLAGEGPHSPDPWRWEGRRVGRLTGCQSGDGRDLRALDTDIGQCSVIEARKRSPGGPFPSPSIDRADAAFDGIEHSRKRRRHGLTDIQERCGELLKWNADRAGIGGLPMCVSLFHVSISNSNFNTNCVHGSAECRRWRRTISGQCFSPNAPGWRVCIICNSGRRCSS